MSYEQNITVIDNKSVLAECGPMRLVIQAWQNGQPQLHLVRQAAEKSFFFLNRIASCRSELSHPISKIENSPQDPFAVKMVKSVYAVGDDDLTPMAAVAGTIADEVADWLFAHGMTKVIVDNGGDIAIRLDDNETATVGIRPTITSSEISHLMHLDTSRRSWGVTTSGVGGRSFTRGVASAATVLADNASMADAAATAIANACTAEDAHVIQVQAEDLDPNTDLKGIAVTAQVGPLSTNQIVLALEHARLKADYLCQKGVIIGAFIALENMFAITEGMRQYTSAVNILS